MALLSAAARRRSLQPQLENIERKVAQSREEIGYLQQESGCRTPDLFIKDNPGLQFLKARLQHLERRAKELREKLRRAEPSR